MPTYTARRGWQRVLQARIPTLAGLGILILGVVVGIIVLGQGTTGFLPRASEDTVPRNIRITNITDTGFSVSFLTDISAPGYLEYGSSPTRTNVQVRDDRDQLANTVGNFTTHHVTVRGLQPTTQYYFRLGTGSGAAFDNNGQPFSVRTARAAAPGSEARTAYGVVNTEVGNPADGAIIYLTIQGASPQSAQVKSNGSWALPLSVVRSLDLSATIPITDTTPVQVEVQGSRRTDSIKIDSTVGQLLPLETLQFGQAASGARTDGTSTAATQTETTTSTATNSAQTNSSTTTGTTPGTNAFGTMSSGNAPSTVPSGSNEAGGLNIRLQNQETVNATNPEFQGSAPPGGYVQIEVNSEPTYFGAAQASPTGEWNWTPPGNLAPGPHTITVTYVDAQGKQQQIQRNFIVQATGSSNQPAFTSTPSAVVTSPTPKPSPTPTATPNLIAQATATPTPIPTLKPSPTATPSGNVATAAAQPVSGSVETTWSLIALALTFFAIGGGWTTWQWVRAEATEEDR